MLLQILANTPKWVFALFAALLALGLSQLLTRRVGLARVTALALGMCAFSLYGTVSAFNAVPLALLAWLASAAAVLALLALSAVYGAFSGVFLARAARLWRLVLAHERQLLVTAA